MVVHHQPQRLCQLAEMGLEADEACVAQRKVVIVNDDYVMSPLQEMEIIELLASAREADEVEDGDVVTIEEDRLIDCIAPRGGQQAREANQADRTELAVVGVVAGGGFVGVTTLEGVVVQALTQARMKCSKVSFVDIGTSRFGWLV